MRKFLTIFLIILFFPFWLILLFFLGQNTAPYFFRASESFSKFTKIDASNFIQNFKSKSPKFFIVQSGSMEPAVKVGSLVVVYPDKTYVNGDIVSYDLQGNGKNIVTHRIAYKSYPEGVSNEPVYITKGDANNDFDSQKIKNENIVGKVRLTIPYLGYLVSYAKKPWGFIFLVIVPATILIYEELKNIFKTILAALGSLLKKTKNKYSRTINSSKAVSENLSFWIPKIFIFFPIFGAGMVFLGLSVSFFIDKEETLGNAFQAAENFATPTPTPYERTLVMNEFLWKSSCTPNPEDKIWIELWNGSGKTINLKDWRLRNGFDEIIQIQNSNQDIAPGGFVLLVKSHATFTPNCEGQTSVLVLNLGGNPDLSPQGTGGILRLERPNGSGGFEVVDRIDYGPLPDFNGLDTEVGGSIERKTLGLDSAFADSFEINDFTLRNSASKTPGS